MPRVPSELLDAMRVDESKVHRAMASFDVFGQIWMRCSYLARSRAGVRMVGPNRCDGVVIGQRKQETIAQTLTRVQDRLRLGHGQHPRQLLRRLDTDHASRLRLVLEM